jgi:hypothetical protein
MFSVRSAYKVQREYDQRTLPRGRQSTSSGAAKAEGGVEEHMAPTVPRENYTLLVEAHTQYPGSEDRTSEERYGY